MQAIVNVFRRRANFVVTAFLACTLSLIFYSCENPGSVGESFTDIGTEIVVDTLEIGDISTDSVDAFSGMLNYISAGQFNDPMFGNIKATGLIRPSLPSSSSESDFVSGAEMRLKLVFDKNLVYGDRLSTAQYDLVEIDQVWRGKSWKLSNDVQLANNDPIASFEVGQEDSLEVPLDSAWVSRYREFYLSDASNRDSLYTYEFHGLALVPRNETKIIPFDPSGSEFVIYNPEADTVSVEPSHWAYSLERTNAPEAPSGSEKAFSTLERVLSFGLDLEEKNLINVNISKVDLVLYQNTEAMDESLSQVSASAERPDNTSARLHLINPDQASTVLDPGDPIVVGQYKEADQAFHFNITSFVNEVLVNGVPEGRKFYFRLQTNNGVVRSSLLYNHNAPVGKRPTIIVTSTKPEGSSS